MASKRFVSGAPAVKQINTETPANPETGDVFNVKLEDHSGNIHTISFPCGATETVAAVVTGLTAAAVAADTAGAAPWNAVTCTDDTAEMTITAGTAGDPFWVTATSTGDGGPADSLTDANTTAVGGPSIYNDPENWFTQAIPVDETDSVVITSNAGSTPIYGFDDTAVEILGFEMEAGYTGAIGSHARPLKIDLATNDFVTNSGSGEKHIYLVGSGDIFVNAAPPSPGTGQFGLSLTGTSTGDLFINTDSSGSVGIGPITGDASAFTDVKMTNGNVTIGDGGLGSTGHVTVSGGVLHNLNTMGTGDQFIDNISGTVYLDKNSVKSMRTRDGATTYFNSGTTVGLSIYGGGTVDCTKSAETRTGSLKFYGSGGTYLDPNGSVTLTTAYEVNDAQSDQVKVVVGYDKKFTVANI